MAELGLERIGPVSVLPTVVSGAQLMLIIGTGDERGIEWQIAAERGEINTSDNKSLLFTLFPRLSPLYRYQTLNPRRSAMG
jgi:hypothetical protein